MARSYHGSILKIDMNSQIMFFQWAQLKHAIPPRCKKKIFDYSNINKNDLSQNHHVIKRARILPLDKLSSKEIYPILHYLAFNIKFLTFLNEKLYTFGIINTALCSFCNTLEETPIHIFFDCVHVKCLWERLQMKFQNDFILPSLTLQTAILRLYNKANDNYNLLSHILLIFKYIYISREKRTLNTNILIANLRKVKKREKEISICKQNLINNLYRVIILFMKYFL